MEYETITVKRLYVDETVKLFQFISSNYDWETANHLVYVESIGGVGLTDEYKETIGHKHQILEDIILKVRKDISKEKREELERIISLGN